MFLDQNKSWENLFLGIMLNNLNKKIVHLKIKSVWKSTHSPALNLTNSMLVNVNFFMHFSFWSEQFYYSTYSTLYLKIKFPKFYFDLKTLFRVIKCKYFDYGHVNIDIWKLQHHLHCKSNLFINIIFEIFKSNILI